MSNAAAHARSCKIHAVRRMRERVDTQADAGLIKRLSRIIRHNPPRGGGNFRDGRKYFDRDVFWGPVTGLNRRRVTVILEGKKYVVIYDSLLKTIVTVLT